MKKIIALIIISAWSLKLYSQNSSQNREPTYYLDSVECNGFPLFDMQFIDNLQVGHKVGTNGQVFINTKRSHKFNWIGLSTIAANYSKYKTALFMVNNELVKTKNPIKLIHLIF